MKEFIEKCMNYNIPCRGYVSGSTYLIMFENMAFIGQSGRKEKVTMTHTTFVPIEDLNLECNKYLCELLEEQK